MRVLVVAIYDMGEEGENGDGGMDEEEKKGENAALVVLLGDGGTRNRLRASSRLQHHNVAVRDTADVR